MRAASSDEGREVSIAETTRRWIDQHPSVRDALIMGIVNHSALARHIMQETGIDREDAVIASCRRYDLDGVRPGHQEAIRRLLRQATLEMRSHAALITLHPSRDLHHRLEKALVHFKRNEHPLHVVQGSESVTIITDEAVIDALEDPLGPEQVIKKRAPLVELNLRVPPDNETVPGVVAYLTTSLAKRGINILESLSVYRDNLFLIEEKDLSQTYDILSGLLRNGDPLRPRG
jgi:hypothetical protein